jgi:hypothetical protein
LEYSILIGIFQKVSDWASTYAVIDYRRARCGAIRPARPARPAGEPTLFILYFYGDYRDYFHTTGYEHWTGYNNYRTGESLWLVPGTDPDDPFYL